MLKIFNIFDLIVQMTDAIDGKMDVPVLDENNHL